MTDTLHTPAASRLLPRGSSGIRLAVAGLGKMGMTHLNTIRTLREGGSEEYYKDGLPSQLGRLRICGVCDPRPETREQAKGLPWFPQWERLLAERRPHVAIIASPTSTHMELARLSLEAGVHTLVEKPLAPTLQECRELSVLSRAKGCRLLAGHVERYNPVSIRLKNWLSTTGLSTRFYRFERTQPLPDRIPEDILTDKLIHDLDLALYFFGPVVQTEVQACTRSGGRIVEAYVRLAHASGTEGALFVSWRNPDRPPVRRVNLLGEGRERIQGDFLGKTLARDGEPVPCGVKGWVHRENNQIKDQLTDFIATCLVPTGETPPPLLTQEEILEAMRILELIRTQADHV